ncbi:alpha/beta fold hydrolase [Nocardia iowensis]|uniref:Alpha/beta hydrolase n=1 Tax=Nocardia iowensis TaxID=204891 RepID=A0ABX8RUE5_NOCIO|nr:alpha/beta fold hydrolase [Nocardia iowensis]QXN93250.1 alpha/beta hydrolase [Nocardia iowensis]
MTTSALTALVRGTGPGLLLAHGASSDIQDSFGPLVDRLAREHTVVGPDYPGSGATPRAEKPLTADELADQLVAAADRAGLNTFAVLGFSTGSPIAVRTAIRHPDRVTALVLSAGLARPNPRLRLVVETWRALAAAGDPRSLAAYLVLIGWSARWLDERSATELDTLIEAITSALPAGADDQLDLLTRIDVRADLGAIRVPTLVVAAAHDQVVSSAHSRELLAGIPGARYVELDSGHALADERPGEWAQIVIDFLADR